MNDDEKALIEELNGCATKIKTLREARLELQKSADTANERIHAAELRTYAIVAGERNEDGKPTFTNDKAREAEIDKRLDYDTSVRDQKMLALELSTALKKNDIELDFYEMKFKNLHARAKLMSNDRQATIINLK